MFSIGRWAEALADRVRHLALNPPLAPGGDGGGAVADAVAAGDDVAAAAPPTAALVVASRDDPLILRYLPLVVLLALFWPVVFALVAASVSASSWLFWLAVSAAFGTLQLLYVLYNFAMIFWDMGALTLLKTFAVLRSFSRYYLYKMTDATGLGGRRSKERGGRKRRRKEWREEADGARNYEEYCAIEIYEPEPRPREGSAKAKATRGVRRGSLARSKIRQLKRFASVASVPSVGSEDDGSSARSESWSGPSPPAKSGPRKRAVQCPSSPIRRNRSTNSFGSISIRDSRDSPPPRRPMRRSTSALRLSESTDAEEEEEEGVREAVRGDMGMSGGMLLTTLARLKEAREHEDWSSSMSSLKTLLSGIVKRNHLSVDDFLMQDARSVAERGQHDLRRETREAIDRYGQEVERCIDWVAGGPVRLGGGGRDEATPGGEDKPSASASDEDGPNGNTLEQFVQKQREELMKRIIFFKKMKQNLGHTALMLSGGGALTMYHLGTVKALVESDLYKHIHVISGTSGGSISAAMCAIKTPEELLRDICVNTVSTDYMHTGEMKRKNVSWFPELYKMGAFWLKNRLLMDSKEFYRCCEHYYSDITFEEAFEMTGKLVCITVSASRASAGSGVQRLLLNHISTPNVTLASAVTASCAVPGVMAPAKLLMKDGRGEKVPFEVDGVEWIDGSVQADLPFKRISTLFNVSNFVVAQTNVHVVPFLNKPHHPNINTLYWSLFQMCMWDIRSRVLNLSQLGLFPKLFGQDLSKMFKQKYYGKLTLVPRFTTLQLFGLKLLSNPTVADMDVYLQNGQLAAWPFLRVLQEMLRLERSVDSGLAKLDQRLQSLAPIGFSLPNDDVDSLSSALGTTLRARLPGLNRETELLKEKVRVLEQENRQLHQQVQRLQRSLGIPHSIGRNTLEGRLVSVPLVEEDDAQHREEKKGS